MLIKRGDLDRIVAGEISVAFRRWKRPTVKAGGRLRTAVGELAIGDVRQVSQRELTREDARLAGFASLAGLVARMQRQKSGQLYRIELSYAGADRRVELRGRDDLSPEEADEIRSRLQHFDSRSRRGLWTAKTLQLIEERPATLAAKLAAEAGWPTDWFKRNVRKLKELGLTESLERGYRLSPRGRAFTKRRGR